MKIGVYTRKSKITEKGDSIENQIKICKDYINTYYKEAEIKIYEDEGFSGGNIERPKYKQLIEDINNKKIDLLICYRLDRISRNVADFSATLTLLQEKDVGFISIKESFDTTTPIGRAMVYISSVFAQLERETIGERIKDNLEELVRSGRYIGSKPILGYKKKQIKYTDKNNNIKSYNIIEVDNNTSYFIKDMYMKYLDWQNFTKLQSYYMQANIKTQNNKTYKNATIKKLLTHPFYACADKYTYDFFLKIGCKIIDPIEKFNGKHGINVYRLTKKNKQGISVPNIPKNWIIGVGTHSYLISSKDWIKTQEIINQRKNLTIRRPIGKCGLLSGILKCGNCGDYMRPAAIRNNRFYYSCNTKNISKKKLCNIKNIRGDLLDIEILCKLFELYKKNFNNLTLTKKRIYNIEKDRFKVMSEFKKELGNNRQIINSLLEKLSISTNSATNKYIEDYIEKLHLENRDLSLKLETLYKEIENNTNEELNIDILRLNLNRLNEHSLDFLSKRNMIRNIISDIIYTENNIEINILL